MQEDLGTSPNVIGKCGYLCHCGQEGYQNGNFRVLLQERKEDPIDKRAQYKFRQCYPKEVKLTQKIKTFPSIQIDQGLEGRKKNV